MIESTGLYNCSLFKFGLREGRGGEEYTNMNVWHLLKVFCDSIIIKGCLY